MKKVEKDQSLASNKATEMKRGKTKPQPQKNPLAGEKAENSHKNENLEEIDELLDQKVSLEKELEEHQKKLAENEDFILRLKADFDNYRKRVLDEKERLTASAGEEIFKQFLKIYDSYSKALNVETNDETTRAFLEGFKMIKQEMDKFLDDHKVMISTKEGDLFDPNIHQAIFFEETDNTQNEEKVMEIFQNGYLMNGRLIREAVVKVEKPKVSEATQTDVNASREEESEETERTGPEDR